MSAQNKTIEKKQPERNSYYLTYEEAAKYLKCSLPTVHAAINRGDLNGVRPPLFFKLEDGTVIPATGLKLPKDLVTMESAKKFREIRKERDKTGKLGKPRRGKEVFVRVERIGRNGPKFEGEFEFENEGLAVEFIGIGKTKLRRHLREEIPIEKGKTKYFVMYLKEKNKSLSK